MQNSIQTYATLQEEVESVKEYLENESYKYKEKLSWELSQDPEADTRLLIPKTLIRTFVENAITHGLIQNPEGGLIEISVHKSALGTLIMVVDNGTNHEETPSIREHQNGKLRCLDEYLKLFNEQHPYSVKYNILSRSLGERGQSGSRVLITVKHQ